MLARERFLNPNNATMVIIGGVQTGRAMRTLRQLLGVWRKSEQVIPATFRQPTPPDPRTLIINAPADQSAEVRLAVRGFARQDPDTAAATVLASVARQRWTKLLPDLERSPVFVRHEPFALPGIFSLGATVENLLAGKTLATAQEAIRSLVTSPVTSAELEVAKTEISQANKDAMKPDQLADALLDVDTYGLPTVAEQNRAFVALSPNDLQRAASRLFREGSLATVVVGNSELVKTQIERFGKVEMMGELETKPDAKTDSKSNSNSAKPQTKSVSKPD
jgi:predicted Zn-dependent peptidase